MISEYKKDLLDKINSDLIIIKTISKELKNDKEFMLEVIKNNGVGLKYASERLRDDKDFILEALKKDGFSLSMFPKDYKEVRRL